MEILKMTDDLSGLSVKLRKAAVCMLMHYPADKKAHSGKCVYWLPAVLVEQEMQGKEEEQKRIKEAMKEVFCLKLNVALTYKLGRIEQLSPEQRKEVRGVGDKEEGLVITEFRGQSACGDCENCKKVEDAFG